MSEPHADVESLFEAARQLRDPQQRLAFLTAACADQPELRRRLDRLLEAQPEADSFFEQPPERVPGLHAEPKAPEAQGMGGASALPSSMETPEHLCGADESVGTLVGRYKLLQKVGEGGCGVVYMAEQIEPVHRRVALKVIKLGMDTKSVIARFEAEQQALALMDHPHIARVLEVGATNAGRPFFVMELVRGIPITRYCDEQRLRTEERLRLFVQVCQAIQHAHQKGIIHRDIKPSNILVTVNDGVAVPKVIDFGIAKATTGRLTERTLFTAFQQFIGTPAYVSPEQAEMTSLDIDTRSDIYSLGVLLYELLTGTTPFDASTVAVSGLDEMRRRIREQEPPCPSTRLKTLNHGALTTAAKHRQSEGPKLIQRVRGDLDWIVTKCLEKERARRYETANGLAADVTRHLDNEPVVARPPSRIYRIEKMIRRHRIVVGVSAGFVTVLVLASLASTLAAFRANRARDRAEQILYAADMMGAQNHVEVNNFSAALKLLNRHRPAKGQADLRGFEWRWLWQRCQGDPNIPLEKVGTAWWLDYSLDGRWLAASSDHGVSVFDMAARVRVAELGQVSGPTCGIFTPDGKGLIMASTGGIRFFETSHWIEKPELALTNEFGPIALSADGGRLATVHVRTPFKTENLWNDIHIWNLQTRKIIRTIQEVGGPPAFSPDGTLLATDSSEGITLWPFNLDKVSPVRLEDSKDLLNHLSGYQHLRKTIVFSPDGESLAVGGRGGIRIWNITTARLVAKLSGKRNDTAIAFSSDGRYLACSNMDRVMLIWEVGHWLKEPRELRGHLNEVWSVAFAPDGKTLVSGGWDRLRLWELTFQQPPARNEERVRVYWVAPDGTEVVTSSDHRIERWNTVTGDVLHFLDDSNKPPGLVCLTVAPDGRTVFGGYTNGEMRVADMFSHSLRLLPDRHTNVIENIAISPDGKSMVSLSEGTEMFWWDLTIGHVIKTSRLPEPGWAQFSPDGKLLSTCGSQIRLWDVATRSLKPNSLPTGLNSSFAFSPNGLLYVIAWPLQLRALASGALFGVPLEGNKQMVFDATFSPDGRTVASAGDDGTLRLWSVDTQQELLTIRQPETTFRFARFSADGNTLVAGSAMAGDGGVRILHVPSFPEIDAREKANLHNH